MKQNKPYLLTFFAREGYTHATVVSSEIDYDIAMDYLREVTAKCRAEGHSRVLLERDIPASLDDAQTYAVSRDAAPLLFGLRVACLNKYEHNVASLKFASNVATNRGAKYELFDSRSKAESWLLQ